MQFSDKYSVNILSIHKMYFENYNKLVIVNLTLTICVNTSFYHILTLKYPMKN